MSAIDDANNYIGAAFGPTYTAWMLLSDDDKGRTLVGATRLLNAMPWQGVATGVLDNTATTLAWPRSGVVVDGVEVDSTTIPNDIVQAAFELAVAIAADPALVGKADQGSNISSVSAGGGVGVAFFNATSTRTGTATLLPVVVQRLVGRYLSTATGAADGGSAGVGRPCSQFSAANSYRLWRPQ